MSAFFYVMAGAGLFLAGVFAGAMLVALGDDE